MLKKAELDLIDMILNVEEYDIDSVCIEWVKKWEDLINIEQLADMWNDVILNLSELN
jgi:hypothetical protein